MAGRISHQSAHAGKLLYLLVGASGARISHHEYIIVFIKSSEKPLCKLLIGLLPSTYDRVIALALGDFSSAEMLGDLIDLDLCLIKQFILRGRDRHI